MIGWVDRYLICQFVHLCCITGEARLVLLSLIGHHRGTFCWWCLTVSSLISECKNQPQNQGTKLDVSHLTFNQLYWCCSALSRSDLPAMIAKLVLLMQILTSNTISRYQEVFCRTIFFFFHEWHLSSSFMLSLLIFYLSMRCEFGWL